MSKPALISIIHDFADPGKPALHRLMDPATGTWTPITCAEFRDKVLNFSAALLSLGLEPQQTLGIFSENRPEYLTASFAAWQIRCVTVGIYATSSPEQVRYLVDDAKIATMVVGSQTHYDIARQVGVKQIIAIDPDIEFAEGDTTTLRFSKVLDMGHHASGEIRAKVAERADAVTHDDLATLLYTSGTTGEPKGAMLTHRNFTAAMEMHRRALPMLSAADSSLNFLPLTHVFELAWSCLCLYLNMEIYVNTDPKRAQLSLREVQPTCMCSVPRFWEKVYAVINEKLTNMGVFSKAMMNRAIAVGRKRNMDYVRKGLPVPRLLEMEYQSYNNRVFRKVRSLIGVNRGNIFPTAGAPVSPKIVEFFHAIGVNILVGYGLSETTATVTFNPAVNWELGSVGQVIGDVRIRIGDDDEVQVKGPTVMAGYFDLPEATEAAFTSDGWFRTGDAGRIDRNGNLFLTDRIKDLFKTANGKYIAPQALEMRLGRDSLFEQVAIIGDSRKFVSALIVPDYAELQRWAESHKLGHLSKAELAVNPKVIEHVQERIEAQTADLAPYEHIRRFTLLTEPFSIENGELTNTLKIRRRVIADRYADEIDRMYL